MGIALHFSSDIDMILIFVTVREKFTRMKTRSTAFLAILIMIN